MDQLISILFLARDLAHREHLQTRSYAQHMALGEFYNTIIEKADDLAEAYQGQSGELIGNFEIFQNQFDVKILDILNGQVDWIKKNRYKIIDKNETALHNIIDEILGVYYRALYKLKFLS